MRAESILIELVMVVHDQPPLNREAHEWLASHGLTELHEIENHGFKGIIGEFPTAAGLNLYHTTVTHFRTMLDSFHESGQLNTPANYKEPKQHGRKKVHNNTDQQDPEARDVTGLTQQETATFIATGTRDGRPVGSTNRNVRRSNRGKSKGHHEP